MIIDALIAFILIFVSTYLIYFVGKKSAPKPVISENQQDAYACGEKVSFQGIKIDVQLYNLYPLHHVFLNPQLIQIRD